MESLTIVLPLLIFLWDITLHIHETSQGALKTQNQELVQVVQEMEDERIKWKTKLETKVLQVESLTKM